MHLKVLRVSRYTSVILLNFSQTDIQWLPKIETQMRYYEDAKMLEVIEWCSDGQSHGSFQRRSIINLEMKNGSGMRFLENFFF